MDLGIAGERALVVAASQGVGAAIARDLAKEGVRVVVVARREGPLEDLVETIGGAAAGHEAISEDLMMPGGAERAAKMALAGGDIGIVVHCAGGTFDVRSALSTVDDWNRVWQYNVGIAIEMNRLLIPPMQKRGWGRVVHISSQAAVGLRGAAAYGPSKRALDGYVKVLGREVAPDGVVVSALQPGAYQAEGGHWDEIARERPEMLADFLRHHQALGRIGTVDEIAPLAVFMCARQATFCSGSLMQIDGGTM